MKKEKKKTLTKQKINYVVVILIIFTGVLYLFSLNNFFWVDGDNAKYTELGISILHGKYNNIWEITEPPHVGCYWPGFPLMLTLPLLLFGKTIIYLKLIPIICNLIGLLYLYKYIRLKWGERWALPILFLLCINPAFFTYAHTVLTQAPFFMSLIIAFYYAELFIKNNKPIKSKEFILMTFFTILSKYIRAEGDFLFIFMVIYLLLRKRRKPAIILGISFIVGTGIWWIREIIAAKNATPIQKRYFINMGARLQNILKKSLAGESKTEMLSLKELIERAIDGWKAYFLYIIPANVFGTNFMIGSFFWALLISFLVVLGFFDTMKILKKKFNLKRLFQCITVEHLYFVFGIVLVILALGKTEKYLYPVIPFIIFYIFRSLYLILRQIKISSRFILVLITLIFAIFSLKATYRNFIREKQKPYYDPALNHYMELAKWAGKNLPQNSKIITRKPEYFWWYSGLKGANIRSVKDPIINLKYFADLDADYLTVTFTGFDGITNPYLFLVLKNYPQFFEPVKVDIVPGTGGRLRHFLLKIKKKELKEFIKRIEK